MKKLITVLLICISFSLNAKSSPYLAAICDDEKIDHACCYVNNVKLPLWVRNDDPRVSNRIKNYLDIETICSEIESRAVGQCTKEGTPEYEGSPKSRVPRDCIVVQFK